ncbi:MAG: 30S ribosomal protein S12 methylthiotransferase RimO [Bacteroidetes bacterium]|nr:30S ribosomal protein S12 methylthiotransferase RimO [Bacteroidota bacterium]MBU1117166.1 30S ribosomal protein S12 methylthiotransferase RimO [Bacteroidota bacterium]MBU1798562.1 30S ribosomal protein S12 methylthiotransferase RimO [Bacteroidota bacterium]
MKQKIGIITMGCSKNAVDSERLMAQLKINDFEIVTDPNEADSLIINTCGFINTAKEESINTILEAIALKKENKVKKVYVAGCLSERYEVELKKDIPEVDGYFGTEDYKGIVEILGGRLKTELLGERELSTPKHFAYIKISEGCDNPCSFCAIPLIRGKYRSKSIDELVVETKSLAAKGVKELILIGQDTTEYGLDLYGKRNLNELFSELSNVDGIEWIRILYTYPSHFPIEAIEEIARNPKVLNYVDMPLQHISDNVLKGMRRGITKRRTVELIETLRAKIPNLTLRTTFIVGFPDETDEDFNELCEFVKETKFDRVGVFNYSQEDDTTGFVLGDPITEKTKVKRNNILMEIQKEISLAKNEALVGKTINVIIDSLEGDYYVARSERDAPEVDGEVLIDKDENVEIGNIYKVEIIDFNDYDLFAKLN